jgi:short-subunit dehydrogenase
VAKTLSGVAVVTGATGGIGKAVARALADLGMGLCLTGRDPARLQNVAREVGARAPRVVTVTADLAADRDLRELGRRVAEDLGRVDVLVHAAGALRLGNLEAAGWEDLDEQYRVNLRAPFLLTKLLLPLLRESAGQIVFVNSTSGLAAGADNALYAATKSGLKSLAGSIRDHLNPLGIRVVSVFPGRTDTPMQQAVLRFEGREDVTDGLLSPSDVAEVIAAALVLPRTAEVTDVMVRPMRKLSSGRQG